MRFYLLDIVIQEKGFYVYIIHFIVHTNLSISIAPVRSRVGSEIWKSRNKFHKNSVTSLK
jgi:hypothetical protein